MDKKLQKQLLEAQMRTNQQAALQGGKPLYPASSNPSAQVRPSMATDAISHELAPIKRDTWFSLGMIALIIAIFVVVHYTDRRFGYLQDLGNYIFSFLE